MRVSKVITVCSACLVCLAQPHVRQTPAEQHTALVASVRKVISERRLNVSEMAVAFEAASPYGQYQGCAGEGCADRIECSASSERTSVLLSQLSFWPHSESDLPLELMESYLKGMNCDNRGITKAYEVMNDRIDAYLRKAAKQAAHTAVSSGPEVPEK